MPTPAAPLDDSITVVGDVLRVNAAKHPEREAVVDGERRLNWGRLAERVTRIANAMRSGMGIAPGERIAILADNSLEYFELFHATAAAGIVAVPLNQRLAAGEIAQITERVEPRAIFASQGHLDHAAELARAGGATLVPITGEDRAGTYDDWGSRASSSPLGWRPSPDDPATICFTGGTTGLPKGVVIPHRALAFGGRSAMTVHGLKPFDRHVFVRPMAVAPGHRMISWHGSSGGTTIIAPKFEPGSFERLVAAEGGTATLLSATMFQMWLEHGVDRDRVATLRSITYGGMPATSDLLARVLAAVPAGLQGTFGGTEMNVPLYLDASDHVEGKLDSVGREAPGAEVHIVDEEGNRLGPGETGEVIVRSPELMTGYWRDPEATAAALRDGFYWTGDLGVRDEEGYVRIVGRRKDMIISGGFNVYPIEVENVLAAHPAVREVAVIGLPHDRWGEAVHAVVVPEPGERASAEDLIEFCRGRIAGFKKPQSVEFVDELPRTTVGKVAKKVLRDERIARRV